MLLDWGLVDFWRGRSRSRARLSGRLGGRKTESLKGFECLEYMHGKNHMVKSYERIMRLSVEWR